MFENKNFQSWFKENTPKEGLSETTTFSKQFVKDAWDNGYYVGYNKAKEEMQAQIEKLKSCSNCIHYSSTFGLCHYSMGDEDYDCRGRKWEIKEND